MPLELTVSSDGSIRGSWDATASAQLREGRRPWRTAGRFEGLLVTPHEFKAEGSATEVPLLAGSGDGLLIGEIVVRGTLSDDGLALGTLFVDADSIVFQAVKAPGEDD